MSQVVTVSVCPDTGMLRAAITDASHRSEASVRAPERSYCAFVIDAYGGENEVSLYSSFMQDGTVDLVLIHAQVDNPILVEHKAFRYRPSFDRKTPAQEEAMLEWLHGHINGWLG